MQGPIHVKSEIGPLQKVLLHRPGRELEYLVPDALERLLFDDIPYLHGAQQEHDRFVQLLRENGTEVVFLEDLTAEAIETDDPVRDAFIDAVISGAGALAERGIMKTEFFDAAGDHDLFGNIPWCDPVKVVAGTIRAAKKGRTFYTPTAFNKFYRFVAKLLPMKWMIKATRV